MTTIIAITAACVIATLAGTYITYRLSHSQPLERDDSTGS